MSVTTLDGNIRKIKILEASLTPSEVATITAPEQTFTVNGLTTDDVIIAVNPPSVTAGVTIGSFRISAANTLALQFCNPTAGNLTPASGTHKIVVATPESATESAY